MSDEEMDLVDQWISEHLSYDTFTENEIYYVGPQEMESFVSFLAENFPDLIFFKCLIMKSGIEFCEDDLKNAEFQ